MSKKRTTKGTKRTIVIYLIIIALLYGIIYIVPQVSDIFVETYTAEYDTLQVTDETTCLFIRNEKVYTAGAGGSVNREVKEGRMMRAGAHIADVGNTAYYSDMKGIVSYDYDGLETVYTPDSLDKLTASALDQVKESAMLEMSSKEAAAGDAIFKIADNQKWYLACWIDKADAEKYDEGGSVLVDFKDGVGKTKSTQISMAVQSKTEQGGLVRMILSCNRHYEDFSEYRIKECTLIASSTSGIFLETDSIVEEDGQKGVYVVDKLGNYNFTPIKILDQEGDITVVEKNYFYDAKGVAVETVQNYFEILRPDVKATQGEEKEEKKEG